MENNQIIRREIAYYDAYEFRYGDGFCPAFDPQGDPYNEQAQITFAYDEHLSGWIQTSNYCIVTLDADFGTSLLARLNSPDYILQPPNPVVYIYNLYRRRIHPNPNNNN
jgi:hypothetical protein